MLRARIYRSGGKLAHRVMAPFVQYVRTPSTGPAPQRSALRDGLSWETAQDTILDAYDRCHRMGGGTIYVADRSWMGRRFDNGLWIWQNVQRHNPYDPADAQPTILPAPPGWRHQETVRIVGVGGHDALAQQPEAAVHIIGGSATDPMKPIFRAAGTNAPIRFDHIIFSAVLGQTQLGITQAWQPIRLGCVPAFTARWTPSGFGQYEWATFPPGMDPAYVWQHGLFRSETVNWITFFGCGIMPSSHGGPAVDIGHGFFCWFERCSSSAPGHVVFLPSHTSEKHPDDTLPRDRRCAVLVKSDPDSLAFWRISSVDCFANYGGIRFHVTGPGGAMTVRKFHIEDNAGQQVVPGGDPYNPN